MIPLLWLFLMHTWAHSYFTFRSQSSAAQLSIVLLVFFLLFYILYCNFTRTNYVRMHATFVHSLGQFNPNYYSIYCSYNSVVVGEVLEKVLIQGISDPDASVRRVLGYLDARYDGYLADADNLRYLFIALNDEQFQVCFCLCVCMCLCVCVCMLGYLDARYDGYLADADNLRYLFIALNDEKFPVNVDVDVDEDVDVDVALKI